LDSRSFVRDVNLHIHRLATALELPLEYVCECAAHRCVEVLELECADFAEVLALPDCYIVAAGHDGPEDELVSQRFGYLIVRHVERSFVTAG
jgi:Mlc titration factor MtfA (ptsG expression regulator)